MPINTFKYLSEKEQKKREEKCYSDTVRHPSTRIQAAYADFMHKLIGKRVLKGSTRVDKFEVWYAIRKDAGGKVSLINEYVNLLLAGSYKDYTVVTKYDLLDGAKEKTRFLGKF